MAVSQLDTWGTDISTDQCTNLKNQFLTRYDQSVVQLNYHGVNSESAAHILGCFVKYKMVDEFRYYVRIDFEAKEITFPHWKHVSWQGPQSRYTAQIQLNLLKFALLPGAFSEKADVRRFLELFFSRRVQAYDCQYSLAVIGYFSQHPSENKPDLKPLIDSEFVSGQLIVHKMEDTTTVYQIEKYAKKNKCMSTDIIDARHVGKGTVVSFELNKQEKTLKIDKDPCLNHEKMVFTAPSDLAVSKENWCIVSGEAKRIEEYASYLGNMKLLEDPLLCLGLKSGLINYAKCLTVQEVSRKNQLREALLSEKRPEVDEKAFRLALYQYLIFAISPETNKQILSQEFNSLSQMLKSKAMTLLKEYVACALSLARMKKELLREFSTVSSLLKENAVELKMALLQICSDYTDCHSYYWNLKHPILSISILRSFIDSIFKTDDSVLQSQVSPNLDQVIHPNYQLLIPEQYKTKYKKGEKFLYPVTPAKLKLYLSLSYLIMFIRATLFQAQKIDDFQAFFVDIQYCLKRVFRAALMCQDSTIGDVLLDELKSNQQLNKQKGTIQEEPFLSLANSLKLYPALFTIQEIKLVLFPKGELRQLGP